MRHTRRTLRPASNRVSLHRGIFRVFINANNFPLQQEHNVGIYR